MMAFFPKTFSAPSPLMPTLNLFVDEDFGLPNTNKSSNIKLQVFRTQFRGVLDIKFFLFRVAKIFA